MRQVPIWEKSNLTLDEAAAYLGIGKNKLRELTDERNCRFVLWNGNKRGVSLISSRMNHIRSESLLVLTADFRGLDTTE